MNGSKKILLAALLGIIILAFSGYAYWQNRQLLQIASFEQCAAAGFPVMEIFPEVCRTSDGRNFIRRVDNQIVTMEGEFICLPHRDPTRLQTMECAFGLKTASGQHYAISDPQMSYLNSLSMPSKIKVTGVLKPAPDSKYDILGTLEIKSLERL